MKKSELVFSAMLVPIDFLMFLLAGIAAYFLRTSYLVSQWRPVLFELNLPFNRYFILLLIASAFGILAMAISGLYNISAQKRLFKEFFQTLVAVSATLLGVVFYVFLSAQPFESRFIILTAWVFAIIFVFLGRFFVKKVQRYLVGRYDFGVHYVVVVGSDNMTDKIVGEIEKSPDLGYRIRKRFSGLELEAIRGYLSKNEVDEVILGTSNYNKEEVLELLKFCEEQRLDFKFIPDLFQTFATNVELNTFDGAPLIEIKKTSLDGWGKIIKRFIDVIGSLFGLVILSPFFLIISLLIKVDSKGPALVGLARISQRKKFYLYKFRSMVEGADKMKEELMAFNERKGPLFKIKNDPRITKMGRFLRKWRIDELPQLINVLRGEMSLVGPRPHEPREIDKYARQHKKVLLIKPGITGMAQISGSSDLPFEEEVRLDTYYIENWSIKKDIYILLKTFIIIFTDKSAC
ncbi:MAG: exopolysaccharide biosynthesis polyprenyl glycosylphosphotransferase [Candidatus Portnoybacteria bacterium]|nr:exopolysaccharide biosynthesis polyprenyl glycosylphosphotransferase [Candidatus Portnoybacteria bacterium]